MNIPRILLDTNVCFYESCLYVGSDKFSQNVRTLVDNWMVAYRLAYIPEENFVTDDVKKYVLGTMIIKEPKTQRITDFHTKYPQTRDNLQTYVHKDGGLVLAIHVCFPTPFNNTATEERFGDASADSVSYSLASYYG
jgi:hypothetical protein